MADFPVHKFPVTTLLTKERLDRQLRDKASTEAFNKSKGQTMLKPHELAPIEVSAEHLQEVVERTFRNFVANAMILIPVPHHGKAICIRESKWIPSLKERIEAVFGDDAVIGVFLYEGYYVVGYYEEALGHPQPIYKRIK